MKHVMLDVESLGKAPNGAIASIGACRFDLEKGEIGEAIGVYVNVSDACARGMTLDIETVLFWLRQDRASIEATFASKRRWRLDVALLELASFCEPWREMHGVWCNAPLFDFAILHSAYRLAHVECPWKHTQERDARTLHALAALKAGPLVPEKNLGIPHSAIDDARHQAQLVIDWWRALS